MSHKHFKLWEIAALGAPVFDKNLNNRQLKNNTSSNNLVERITFQ